MKTENAGNGRPIVLVDDGMVTRKLLERKLRSLGFVVACAADGTQALELLKTLTPAAVITDLNMPNLDGYGLCRAMRQDSRLSQIPAILTCATEPNPSERQEAAEAGAAAFVL